MLASINKKMKNDVLSLPKDIRAKLAHELIISLDEEFTEYSETSISKAWKKEINRRVLEIKNGTAKGRPAEQVLAEIRAKYKWKK